MSNNESSESSDEEYVPNEVSESESDDVELSHESDVEDCKKAEIPQESKPVISQLEKEKNEKEIWESFKSQVENEKNDKQNRDLSTLQGNGEVESDGRSEKPICAKPVKESSIPDLKSLTHKRTGLSLTNILGQNKKPKMNMLEKSKEDWEKFVGEEGIKDDLKIFNRGKQGFLERKAFEARTELKQFELERNLRLQSKSKK